MKDNLFKKYRLFAAVLLFVIDVAILLAATYVYSETNNDLAYFEYIALSVCKSFFIYLIFLWALFSFVFNLYRSKKIVNFKNNLFTTVVVVLLTTGIFLLTPKITPSLPHNRIPIFLFVGISLVGISFIHLCFLFIYKFIKEKTKVLLLGNENVISRIMEGVENKSNYDGFQKNDIIAIYDTSNSKKYKSISFPEKLVSYAKRLQIDKLVYVESELKNLDKDVYSEVLKFELNNIELIKASDFYEELTSKVLILKEDDKYILTKLFKSVSKKSSYYTINRFINILISAIGLIFTGLLIPFVIFFNFFMNKGPLFYTQERVGSNNDVFDIIKFRSMVTDAEKDGAQWATKNDARITKFGKFLRKTRIDELPQFWNILKGDMNLLGPRPERQIFIDELSKIIPSFTLRNTVKPGVTGWAQIMYKYGNTLEDSVEKLAYDLYYIKHRSLLFDLKIIIKTILVMVKFKGN